MWLKNYGMLEHIQSKRERIYLSKVMTKMFQVFRCLPMSLVSLTSFTVCSKFRSKKRFSYKTPKRLLHYG